MHRQLLLSFHVVQNNYGGAQQCRAKLSSFSCGAKHIYWMSTKFSWCLYSSSSVYFCIVFHVQGIDYVYTLYLVGKVSLAVEPWTHSHYSASYFSWICVFIYIYI